MPDSPVPSQRDAVPAPARAPWVRPAITELPRLTELTLTTNGVPGGGSGGGTVF